MTDEAQSAIAATDPAGAAPEVHQAQPTAEGAIPQVGDLTPSGAIIQGVRRHADGLIEISFNGADFQPL